MRGHVAQTIQSYAPGVLRIVSQLDELRDQHVHVVTELEIDQVDGASPASESERPTHTTRERHELVPEPAACVITLPTVSTYRRQPAPSCVSRFRPARVRL
jgi:hypothetical protein